MSVVTIVYYSGYGHTAKQAEAVAEGIRSASAIAKVYRLTDQGDLPEGMTLEDIGQTDAIIYGSPTYMGGPAWQFKKFADACSKLFEPQAWKDKLAAGFTNSASVRRQILNDYLFLDTGNADGADLGGHRIIAGEQEKQHAGRHQLVFRFWRRSCSFTRRRFGRRSAAHRRFGDRQAIG
jgi:multimeric flavodoxin WrbA